MPEPTLEQQVETLEEKVDALTDLISDLIDYIVPAHDAEHRIAVIRKGLCDAQSIK